MITKRFPLALARRLLLVSVSADTDFRMHVNSPRGRCLCAVVLAGFGSTAGTLDSSHAARREQLWWRECVRRACNAEPHAHARPRRVMPITIFDPRTAAKGLGIVHWVLYGVAPSATGLGAGCDAAAPVALAANEPDGWPWSITDHATRRSGTYQHHYVAARFMRH